MNTIFASKMRIDLMIFRLCHEWLASHDILLADQINKMWRYSYWIVPSADRPRHIQHEQWAWAIQLNSSHACDKINFSKNRKLALIWLAVVKSSLHEINATSISILCNVTNFYCSYIHSHFHINGRAPWNMNETLQPFTTTSGGRPSTTTRYLHFIS